MVKLLHEWGGGVEQTVKLENVGEWDEILWMSWSIIKDNEDLEWFLDFRYSLQISPS